MESFERTPDRRTASASPYELVTRRLRLVPWDLTHLDGLAAINADPLVMQFISGSAESRAQTRTQIERIQARWLRWGYSWWSFIEPDSGEIVGAGCIQNLRRGGTEPDPACPLEIGWRLRRDRWHRGLATEAAIAMADFAFAHLLADALYAVCDPRNSASFAVMQRLGMRLRGIEQWYEQPLTTCEITAAEWVAQSARLSEDVAYRR
jgi:RimJ/RimL family protein N-acetyltransferase